MLYYPEEVYAFVENMRKRGCSARTIFGYMLKLKPSLVEEYNLNHWKVWRIIKQLERGIVQVKDGKVHEGEEHVEKRKSKLRILAHARKRRG